MNRQERKAVFTTIRAKHAADRRAERARWRALSPDEKWQSWLRT